MTTKEAEVRTRLCAVIVAIELASLVLLLLFIRHRPLPDTLGIVIVLLLPIVFGLHVTEEFVVPGGFIRWDNVFRPMYADTPGSYYVKVNAIPGVASLLVSLGAFDYAGKYSMPGIRSWLTFLAFMAWNALFHVRGAIHTRRYSPGMATGLLMFIPLVAISYIHFMGSGAIDGVSAAASIAIALTIQPVLDFIKRRRRKEAI